jgi:hypothetical protein
VTGPAMNFFCVVCADAVVTSAIAKLKAIIQRVIYASLVKKPT